MGGLPPASCSCYNAQPLHSCCTSSSSDTKVSPKPSENGNLEFHPPKDFVYDDEEKDNIQRDKDGVNVTAVISSPHTSPSPRSPDEEGTRANSKGLSGMTGPKGESKSLEMPTLAPEVFDSKDPRISLHSSNCSASVGMPSRTSFDSQRERNNSDCASRSPSAFSSPDNSPSKIKHHRSKDPDACDFTAVSSTNMGMRLTNRENAKSSANISVTRTSTTSSHASYQSTNSNPLGSLAVGSYASKLPSTPELFVVRSQNSEDTIAGSCLIDEAQGRRPGTPRPSRRENTGDAVTHSVSRHSLMSKNTIATTFTVNTVASNGTTRSKSLFAWNDPEQDFKDYRKSVTRMNSRASHMSVFKIPEAQTVSDTIVGDISTIHE